MLEMEQNAPRNPAIADRIRSEMLHIKSCYYCFKKWAASRDGGKLSAYEEFHEFTVFIY